MATDPSVFDDGVSLDAAIPAEGYSLTTHTNGKASAPRKARQKSVYLFPAYGLSTALDIARRVEESGGGSLTEETLAVNMDLSVKSSGFRLKSLAARQFGLINKQGDLLTTTPVAKAIFKPTGPDDAKRGGLQAFLSIPLFRAVSERYRGQRLPDSQTLRNVLEREFHVERSRVQQAERMLLDSAKDAHLLKSNGDGVYLAFSDVTLDAPGEFAPGAVETYDAAALGMPRTVPHQTVAATQAPVANSFSFTLEEIGRLSPEDFEIVWQAVGILVRARSSRQAELSEEDSLLTLALP